ncbi:MAG TPA: hypothetical protein VLA19_19455 [Herpetosiphonaceae bacterium]|nr:hypothetical protein [Herpetosiphonaceae bacterium]
MPEVLPPTDNGTETSEAMPPAEHEAGTPEVPLSPEVAVLTRSGGLMGLNEVLTVEADGGLVLDREGQVKTGQADESVVQALRDTFNSPEWKALAPKYGRQFPDAFAYTVEAGGKTVTTYDGAENPEPLAAVLDQLLALLQSAGSGAGES